MREKVNVHNCGLCLLSMVIAIPLASAKEKHRTLWSKQLKHKVFKEKPQGGFLPPKMRHEHVTNSVAHAVKRTFTKHSTEAPRIWTAFWNASTFFSLGGRLHDATFASQIFLICLFLRHSSFIIFSLYLHFFPYSFTHARCHIVYMCNWIVLYVSCTKINVTHRSVSFVDTD